MDIVLASGSPRRKELLENLGLRFTVRPANADEDADKALPPSEYVKECAVRKARAAAKEAKDGELIIAADTMVFKDGELLGKPKDKADAVRMLLSLSDSYHEVCTGVALYKDGKFVCEAENTKVYFGKITKEDAEKYADTKEPYDKAGAYGIQLLGGIFVKKIEGDYFNVVGLPIHRLSSMLRESFGTDLLDITEKGKT